MRLADIRQRLEVEHTGIVDQDVDWPERVDHLSEALGAGGTLRRFRVGVEQGSREDVTAFAAQVEATLGDPRSWIGGGRLRVQRVAGRPVAG